MKFENVLYKDLKVYFSELFDSGNYPQTLLFAGGSAFLRDFRNTVENIYIKFIDLKVGNVEEKSYEYAEMNRYKKRLMEIYYASKDKNNWNIDLDEWRVDNYFHSHKLHD
jgi:hypothetical protein